MSDAEKAYQATPASTLKEEIMNPCIAKNEREWWAAAEIERLSNANDTVWADNERLRAALLKIKRGSVWNCDIEAFIDAALALPASLRNRMAVLVENIDVDLDSAIDGDVAL
jgi:hypothetical protein